MQPERPGGTGLLWLMLALAQLRAQPLRVVTTVLTLAFGVALFAAVWLVSDAALDEFDQASRRLAGAADIVVRGPRTGFDEQLYVTLARDPAVRAASPVLELDVGLAGRRETLHVLGFDTFRASALQPALIGQIEGDFLGLLQPDAIYVSQSAARLLGVERGASFAVQVGAQRKMLEVRGILPAASYTQPVGIMDIASAQWTLERVGVLNRIDLRLQPAANVDAFREQLARVLPPGLQASTPLIEAQRAATISRAYRVNLSMLALVSLLTGALLLFATQSLSILRRRSSLALLRALGMTRGGLQRALLGEGIVIGACGSLVGIALGQVLALLMLRLFRGAAGGGEGAHGFAELHAQPLALCAFFLLGTGIAALGAWVPAREAVRRPPARALKAGDAELAMGSLRPSLPGAVLLVAGALLALLPSIGGIPVFGYGAIALLLFGALLLVPAATRGLLALVPQSGHASLDIGLAQVRGGVAQLTVSLAPVIVSFSLMVAMAIMVFSFRQSFDRWLLESLPADLQLRVAQGSDTRHIDAAQQRELTALPGVAAIEFRRSVQLQLSPERAPVTVSARDYVPDNRADSLPLLEAATTVAASPGVPHAWVSEAMVDVYGMRVGSRVTLPLAGRAQPLQVAGVFRDYGRMGGTVVMARADYVAVTGDAAATEASVWLAPRASSAAVAASIRARLGERDDRESDDESALQIRTSDEVRALSMRAFDRAFQVTYALEAVAVLIGLVGIACAGASTALARRGEFGMLRHLGMLRRQIVAMLAAEGFAMSTLAAIYGLTLGAALSLVLVHVVNRQSFNWSIDLAFPPWQLLGFSGALLAAATVTNIVSARSALDVSALRAVREDW